MLVLQLDFHLEYNKLHRYKLFLLLPHQKLELYVLRLLCVGQVYLNLLEIIHILSLLKVHQHNMLELHLLKDLILNHQLPLSYTIDYHCPLKLPFQVNPLFFFFEFQDAVLSQCIDVLQELLECLDQPFFLFV